MARFVVVHSLVAAAILASALSVATEFAQAQGPGDDRYFMLRDPFRRTTPFYSPQSERDLLPKPTVVEPPSDQPVGVTHPSTADAEKTRPTPATEFVLVFGDTLADQLAQGLADAFAADRPEVAIIKKTKASTGFVRADFYDWPAQIPALLAAEKASAVVIMLGANDRQQLRDETGAHEPRSDRWRELYGRRVEDTLNRLKEKGVPVFIVGLPAMRSPRLSTDMEYFNDILRERAEKTGAYFVDVWDGFVDEKGEFIAMGPALDGQTRRLRISDGVHFSKAGGRKLAHYVERDLVRLFDQRAGRAPLVPQEAPEIAPSGRPVAGPVLPLTQPAGLVGPLAGGEARTSAPVDAMAARVLVEGMPVEPVRGRADDFRWPSSSASAPPDEPKEQSVALPVEPQAQPVAAEPAKKNVPAQKAKKNAPAQSQKRPATAQPAPASASPQPQSNIGVPDIIRTR